jgi:hypothetical protein
MTWIDRVLSSKHREKRLRDRQRQRQDSEREAYILMSWKAWPEVVDEVARAVEYFNGRVERPDRILLRREQERELEISHKRRPSLRLQLDPESRSIKCEISYREKGWDSDTFYIFRRLGGFGLIERDGKHSLKRTTKRWILKFLEDIVIGVRY